MQEAFESEFLSPPEMGVHTITLLFPPEKEQSKFGKAQWVFECELDGVQGKFAPSVRLLRILAQRTEEEGGVFPLTIQFERIGDGLKTQYRLIQ